METPSTETTPPKPTEFPEATQSVYDGLTKTETNIKTLRDFIEHWKTAFLACENWSVCPSGYPSITISKHYSVKQEDWNVKGIARAFGADGWKREKDSYTCGKIDWKKVIDGVHIKISGAEIIDLKPWEEVRL